MDVHPHRRPVLLDADDVLLTPEEQKAALEHIDRYRQTFTSQQKKLKALYFSLIDEPIPPEPKGGCTPMSVPLMTDFTDYGLPLSTSSRPTLNWTRQEMDSLLLHFSESEFLRAQKINAWQKIEPGAWKGERSLYPSEEDSLVRKEGKEVVKNDMGVCKKHGYPHGFNAVWDSTEGEISGEACILDRLAGEAKERFREDMSRSDDEEREGGLEAIGEDEEVEVEGKGKGKAKA